MAVLLALAITASAASTIAEERAPPGLPAPMQVPVQLEQANIPRPFIRDHGLISFDAVIGDTPVRVRVDNGADLSVIDSTLARRLGLQTRVRRMLCVP